MYVPLELPECHVPDIELPSGAIDPANENVDPASPNRICSQLTPPLTGWLLTKPSTLTVPESPSLKSRLADHVPDCDPENVPTQFPAFNGGQTGPVALADDTPNGTSTLVKATTTAVAKNRSRRGASAILARRNPYIAALPSLAAAYSARSSPRRKQL
jgi:hypothetical protein